MKLHFRTSQKINQIQTALMLINALLICALMYTVYSKMLNPAFMTIQLVITAVFVVLSIENHIALCAASTCKLEEIPKFLQEINDPYLTQQVQIAISMSMVITNAHYSQIKELATKTQDIVRRDAAFRSINNANVNKT